MAMPPNVDPVLQWIRGVDMPAVDEKWVPGATATERQGLAALAALARHLLPAPDSEHLPAAIAQWIESTPEVPTDVLTALQGAMQESPDTTLADLYARIVHNSHRRVLGTFFTPPDEVALMLNMWDASQATPKTVIDVGAGVGVFTASAAQRWPDAAVYAVDVNPVTLGLLAARVAPPEEPTPTSAKSKISLVLEDFTTWLPNTWQSLDPGRLILGNPPYTRSQLLSTEDRVRLAEAAGDVCGSRASLSTIITAVSLKEIGPEDGICLLLPAHWLEADYARPLRKHLAGLKRRRVELRLIDSGLFKDAQVDAVALLVGAAQAEEQALAVANWPGSTLEVVDRDLAARTTWRQHFLPKAGRAASKSTVTSATPAGVPLSDVCTVRRGVATGANQFFLLSEVQRNRLKIDETYLKPVIRRLVALPDSVTAAAFKKALDDERRWLLVVTKEQVDGDADLARYIAAGEADGAHEAELCSRRVVWYDLAHDLVVPDVIIGAMTRSGFRLVDNKVGAAITNNLYGWRWHDGITQRAQRQVLTWLRSEPGQEALTGVSRRPGDGLLKLEPRALRGVLLPPNVAT